MRREVARTQTLVPGFIQCSEIDLMHSGTYQRVGTVVGVRSDTPSIANRVSFCFLATPPRDECEHWNTFRGSVHFAVSYGNKSRARQESSGGGGWWRWGDGK